MASTQSNAEARLESQRLGPLQIRVAFICMLAQIFDGFDISAISMAVPVLIKAWGQPGPAFANNYSAPRDRGCPLSVMRAKSLSQHSSRVV